MVGALASHPVVAVDTESNSLHAYRERVCLIQFSTPAADYIVDPIKLRDISALGPFFANPDQQKVFHAAEYDVVCMRRDYKFEFSNLFDTMSAARTLGWPQVGLADILATHFGVTMNKKHQRADWKRRPLTPDQLDYARLDTHYLVALRDKQLEALTESGRSAEAHEEFERLARLTGPRRPAAHRSPGEWDPAAFWRVKGARDLGPGQAAVLQALFAYREQQAERHRPSPIQGDGRADADGAGAPRAAQRGGPADRARDDSRSGPAARTRRAAGDRSRASVRRACARLRPSVSPRTCAIGTTGCTRGARTGRRLRGVESDVILPRTALWDLARRPPRTRGDLAQIADFGPWRRETYGEEILAPPRRARAHESTRPVIPAEIEDYRDHHWRRDVTRQVETANDAERFIEQIGFAACLSDSRRPGPSLYVAVCGRRDAVMPRNVQKDPEASQTWLLKDEIVRRGKVYYAKLSRGKTMFIAPRMIPYFHAIWGMRRSEEKRLLSKSAQKIVKVLRKEWEMGTKDLRDESGVKDRKAFTGGMDELQAAMIVVPSEVVYRPSFTYIWTLGVGRFPDELMRRVKRETAVKEIARCFLAGAGMTIPASWRA